jgi:peptidyl-prolyl cis-trans isomerase D
MLKVLREGAIENPIFYKIVMGSIAVAFAVSMGWWGFDNTDANAIAQVNESSISMDDYQRAYRNASETYRQLLKERYDDAALRKQVVNELVIQRLWLDEGKRLGITVSDAELKRSLSKIGAFQKDGVFSAEQYHKILQSNRISPQFFEKQQREQMVIERVQESVKDGVALNGFELEEAKKANAEDPDRAEADRLFTKKQRALIAHSQAMKKEAKIQIKEEML